MKYFIRLLVACLLLSTLCTACLGCEKPQAEETEPVFRNLRWAVGGVLPEAADFVTALPEGATVAYAEAPHFSALGEYTVSLLVTLTNGKSSTYTARLLLVEDTEPPEISGAKDLSAYIGDGIAYRTGIITRDNCDNPVTLTVDTSAVDLQTEGVYPVRYLATDAAGNTASVGVSLYLYRERITKEQLFSMLEPIVAARIPTSGSKEMQVREVYVYVYNNIQYDAYSDKSDWVRAAYDGLRTGKGDCFTYFALSKAFFEYLNIENRDVERTPGLVDERHYWNMVNIGSAEAPRWYHFDATQLRGASHMGCLLTDRQVQAYTKLREDADGNRNYFYAYDTSLHPATDTKIITPTPDLEAYY